LAITCTAAAFGRTTPAIADGITHYYLICKSFHAYHGPTIRDLNASQTAGQIEGVRQLEGVGLLKGDEYREVVFLQEKGRAGAHVDRATWYSFLRVFVTDGATNIFGPQI